MALLRLDSQVSLYFEVRLNCQFGCIMPVCRTGSSVRHMTLFRLGSSLSASLCGDPSSVVAGCRFVVVECDIYCLYEPGSHLLAVERSSA
jgi:hypothetical protein